jgi:putative FmdB family regulatory protein
MPTYEYKCRVCRHELEAEQAITDEPLRECPKCLVCALERLISGGAGFVLKGDGWAADGYASKSDK